MEPLTPRPQPSGDATPIIGAQSQNSTPAALEPTVTPTNLQHTPLKVEPTPSVIDTAKPAAVEPAPEPQRPVLGFNEQSQMEETTMTPGGVLALQWLTNALWGWAAVSLSSLTATIFAAFINKSDTMGVTPYLIASLLIILPTAFLADRKYKTVEPEEKARASLAIQVIHTVLFALISVGAAVTALYAIVSLLVGSDASTKSGIVTILSAFMVTIYFGITALRTLSSAKLTSIQRFYPIIAVVTGVLLIVLAVFGPIARDRSLRNDRLIEQNLGQIPTAISSYVSTNEKLPTSLDGLDKLGDGPKKLVDKKLVEYRPDTKSGSVTSQNGLYDLENSFSFSPSSRKTFYYELCVEYKQEYKGFGSQFGSSGAGAMDSDMGGDSDYQTYLSTTGHPAGKQCYKMRTTAF